MKNNFSIFDILEYMAQKLKILPFESSKLEILGAFCKAGTPCAPIWHVISKICLKRRNQTLKTLRIKFCLQQVFPSHQNENYVFIKIRENTSIPQNFLRKVEIMLVLKLVVLLHMCPQCFPLLRQWANFTNRKCPDQCSSICGDEVLTLSHHFTPVCFEY